MKKKTHKEFVDELHKINPSINPLEEYINTDTKIKVECKVCSHVWNVRPSDLLRKNKTGCPKCNAKQSGLKRTKTNNAFKQELYMINPNIEVLEKYVNNHTKIKVKCKICGNIWDATPNALCIRKTGCPICSYKSSIINRTKTHEQFIFELNNINENIDVLEKYINCKTKIKCQCKICGCIWNAIPNDLVGKNQTGCPNCNASKGENRIKKYLDTNNIDYIFQKTFDGLIGVGNGLLSYDFYLPTYNLLIEYQGEFHDGSIQTGFQTKNKLKIQKEHDKRKFEYSIKNNINLLEIWYWDYNNIEQILNVKLNIDIKEVS